MIGDDTSKNEGKKIHSIEQICKYKCLPYIYYKTYNIYDSYVFYYIGSPSTENPVMSITVIWVSIPQRCRCWRFGPQPEEL
jgi:hypothetical protein